MKLLFEFNKNIKLLNIRELVNYIYFEDADFSRIGNEEWFMEGISITLSWNKMVDDERWKLQQRFKEEIDIKLQAPNLIKVEIDNSASYVDKRASLLIAHYFSHYQLAKIYVYEASDDDQIKIHNHFFTKSTFQEAVNVSLGIDT